MIKFFSCSLIVGLAPMMAGCATKNITTKPALENNAELPVRFLPAHKPTIDYRTAFAKPLDVDFIEMNFSNMIEILNTYFGTNLILNKGVDLTTHRYTVHARNQPSGLIFDNLLKALCLNYQPIKGFSFQSGEPVLIDTLMIYKNPNQKDCKPLPSNSEIIVK